MFFLVPGGGSSVVVNIGSSYLVLLQNSAWFFFIIHSGGVGLVGGRIFLTFGSLLEASYLSCLEGLFSLLSLSCYLVLFFKYSGGWISLSSRWPSLVGWKFGSSLLQSFLACLSCISYSSYGSHVFFLWLSTSMEDLLSLWSLFFSLIGRHPYTGSGAWLAFSSFLFYKSSGLSGGSSRLVF